jgi:hypothetical protein
MSWYEYCPDPFDDMDGYGNERDSDGGGYPPSKPTCKFCGKANLTWGHTGKGWKLYEGYERPHVCNRTSTNDFEDLTK